MDAPAASQVPAAEGTSVAPGAILVEGGFNSVGFAAADHDHSDGGVVVAAERCNEVLDCFAHLLVWLGCGTTLHLQKDLQAPNAKNFPDCKFASVCKFNC